MWELLVIAIRIVGLLLTPFRLLGHWILNKTISFDTAFDAACMKDEYEGKLTGFFSSASFWETIVGSVVSALVGWLLTLLWA